MDEPAATSCGFEPTADGAHAIMIGHINAILALLLAVDMQLGGAIVGLDEEIGIVAKSQYITLMTGAFPGLFPGQLSGHFVLVPSVDDAGCDLDEISQFFVAVLNGSF